MSFILCCTFSCHVFHLYGTLNFWFTFCLFGVWAYYCPMLSSFRTFWDTLRRLKAIAMLTESVYLTRTLDLCDLCCIIQGTLCCFFLGCTHNSHNLFRTHSVHRIRPTPAVALTQRHALHFIWLWNCIFIVHGVDTFLQHLCYLLWTCKSSYLTLAESSAIHILNASISLEGSK